jgi:iron-sulfur cluster insertion protein
MQNNTDYIELQFPYENKFTSVFVSESARVKINTLLSVIAKQNNIIDTSVQNELRSHKNMNFCDDNGIKGTELNASQISTLNSKGFRILIEGGGCSGFKYIFSIDAANQEDIVSHFENNFVIIDTLSLSMLSNCHLNYVESIIGSRFSLNNPNAQKSCSCGTSFSL